jgi:hypothetical protein
VSGWGSEEKWKSMLDGFVFLPQDYTDYTDFYTNFLLKRKNINSFPSLGGFLFP